MNRRLPTAALGLTLFVLAGCTGNPEVTKQRLLASGDLYFGKGEYREAALMYARAVQQDRLFGEGYFRLAKAQLKLGRAVEAVRSLHRAVELQPKNAEAFAMLCDVYLGAVAQTPFRRDVYLLELRDLMSRAERQGTSAFEVYRVRGQIDFMEGRHGAAVASFRNALEAKPGDARVTSLLVLGLLEAGDLAEAESVATATMAEDPANGDMYDRLYLIYLRQGRAEEAEKLIETKCERNPENDVFRLQLAAHYHRTGKSAREAEVLEDLRPRADASVTTGVQIAEFFERTGRPELAIPYYQQLAEKHVAEASFLRVRVAEAMTMAGRGADALALVEEIVKDDPKNMPARALLGSLRLFGGDAKSTEAALADMETALAEMPNNPVLRYHLGLAHLLMSDADKAMVRFQEAIGLLPAYEAPRYHLARIYLDRSQPAMAAQLADEILKINPASLRGRIVRADASIRIQEFSQARETLEAVLRTQPDQPDAQFLMAALNVAERRYREAEGILQRLYRTAPQDSRGIRGLIGLYVAEGRPEQAQRLLDAELQKSPGSRRLRLISAQVAMVAKDFERAIADYSAILETDPNQTDVQVALGLAYYQVRDLGGAERHFREAVRVQPRNLTANLRLSMLMGETGRFEEARRILQGILELAPDNPVALNNMAYILADSPATLDTALTLAQRAVSRAPGNGFVAETLAWIYYRKNRSDEAIEIYRGLVDRYPQRSTWRYRYAMALMQKGDRPAARREAETALQRAANAEEEKRIRELLAQLQ